MVGARLRQGVRGGKYEWLGSSLTRPKRGYWTDCQCVRSSAHSVLERALQAVWSAEEDLADGIVREPRTPGDPKPVWPRLPGEGGVEVR
jgi:hypothetical protein